MPIVNSPSEGGASAPSSGSSSTSTASPSSSSLSAPNSTPSGGAAAPASTSAPPSPSPSQPSGPGSVQSQSESPSVSDPSTFNFDEIFRTEEAAPVVAPPVVAPVVPKGPVAETPPVAAEAPKQVDQQQAPAAPQVATATPSPQGESPPPSPADPASMARLLVTNEQAAIDYMAANEFALSAAEIEALETDAVGMIPKLLARAVVRSQAMTLQHLARSVPAMFQQFLTTMKATSEGEGAFYARWPSLKSPTHGELIKRVAQTYRIANPTVPREQMIEEVGAMVMQLAKLPQPQVAATSNGSRPPQPSPFVPAGAGSVTAPQPVEEGSWSILDPTREH